MIKKIINWTLGSFFRTFGRILFYIFLAILLSIILSSNNIKIPGLFNVLNVHAAQSDNWFYNVKNYGTGSYWYINHTSSGTTWLTGRDYNVNLYYNTAELNGEPILRYFSFPSHTNTVTIGQNGVSFTFFSNELLNNGYIYNINTYFCSDSSLNTTTGYITNGSTSSNVINGANTYSTTVRTDLSNVPAPSSYNNLTNCNVYSSLLLPSNQGAWLNIKLRSNTSITTSLYFIGYDIKPLGVDSGTISNIINSSVANSGFASASSVQDVQRSVNQVQQDINNVNSSINSQTQQQNQNHQETMNTITDDSINENGVNSFTNSLNKEYTSLTPFSDFLNLPLNWIRSLLSSSQNCTPINLPLPYLNNKNLTLPCMTEFWNNMGVLGTLIQMVWIAVVGVRIFNGLYLLTCDVLDPNPDKDMIRLKTWEL